MCPIYSFFIGILCCYDARRPSCDVFTQKDRNRFLICKRNGSQSLLRINGSIILWQSQSYHQADFMPHIGLNEIINLDANAGGSAFQVIWFLLLLPLFSFLCQSPGTPGGTCIRFFWEQSPRNSIMGQDQVKFFYLVQEFQLGNSIKVINQWDTLHSQCHRSTSQALTFQYRLV